jgi:endonuclease-3
MHGKRAGKKDGVAAKPPIGWDIIIKKITASLAGKAVPSVSRVAYENPDPFRVLVSTMISLRTKDEVTMGASARLLSRAPSPKELTELTESEIGKLIYPAGFYKTKAKYLVETGQILVTRHSGTVPDNMDGLLALPGVGRKTANLVLNLGFGIPAICVDTHVHRISNRTGWVSTKNPEGTELALMEILPKVFWIPINELLVRFGQNVCTPTSPWCSACPIYGCCDRVGVERHR